MHPFVELAKNAIVQYSEDGTIIEPPVPLPEEMKHRAGVFVSMKKRGDLRGCIGTFGPTEKDLGHEIIRNAISAANEDPRFEPVRSDEIPEITFSVDVLSEPERISGLNELDPRIYGVIVSQGQRRGLLLPDLEGVDTAEEQVRIASMKAGIVAGSNVELYRFRVERYH